MKKYSIYKSGPIIGSNVVLGVGSRKKGFTLFVALLVSSLLLAISLSLSNIILKQLIFTTSGSGSQLAFYAADSGAECALYWDRKGFAGETLIDGAFATSTLDTTAGGPLDIQCGMGDSTNGPKVGSFFKTVSPPPFQDSATTTFYVNYSDASINHISCAKVAVYKWVDRSGTNPVYRTAIDSRGYNAPFVGSLGIDKLPYPSNPLGGHCDTSSSRTVERAVRLDY